MTNTRHSVSVRDAAPLSESSRLALWALVTLCLLIAWGLFYLLAVSALQQARHQHVLYSNFREQLAAATAPVGGAIKIGAPVALLQGPRGLLHDEVVVEGTSATNLQAGPGHVRSTPLPGQAGTTLLYGRATGFGGPFGNLSKLRAGDIITVVTGQGTFRYRVDDIRHAGDRTLPPRPPAVTADVGQHLRCRREQCLVLHERHHVDSTLQGIVAPSPAGRPTAILPSERLLAVEAGPLTLMTLILWLQAFLLVGVATTWSAKRWGRAQTWLIAVPIVAAMLWGLTSTAARVLPNLL